MLSDLESKVQSREALTPAELQRVMTCADLVSVGVLGEVARHAHHGDAVTYALVLTGEAELGDGLAEATEVRLVDPPASWEAAEARVRAAVAAAGGVVVTGFSADQLLALAGGDHMALADGAARLAAAGLTAVSGICIDRVDDAGEVVRALRHGGLAVLRAGIREAADVGTRLGHLQRIADLQAEVGGLQAVSPLPEVDQAETPSTGYDDVRTVTVARLLCTAIPSVQVDWALYGPKLAQVAIAYGADDLDNVPARDVLALGHRRSPKSDIERQIRAAFATPAARDGRFQRLA
jgi:2-iminoacetate synthase ThiH